MSGFKTSTSTMLNPSMYLANSSFLRSYMKICGQTRFPKSFTMLTALWVLGTCLGRKAGTTRSTFRLWPPTSILLLGSSGVGKSQTLGVGKRLLARAAGTLEWVADVGNFTFRPGFSMSAGGFTIRGLTNEWMRVAAGGAEMGYAALEGTHIENEIANVITNRTGTEAITTWMIQVLEHDTVEDLTAMYGHQKLENCTISFAFCSTLQYIRKALSADEFAGGFMHRFLIAYETESNPLVIEKIPTSSELDALVSELKAIYKSAPKLLVVESSASHRLDSIRRQPRTYGNAKLAGFYNRIEGMTLKIAMLMAAGDHRGTITRQDVELAYEMLIKHFAPPLEGIIDQLDASPDKKLLLELRDDLEVSGEAGWDSMKFVQKLGTLSRRRQIDALNSFIELELAFKSVADGQLFATREWRDVHDGTDGHGHEMDW